MPEVPGRMRGTILRHDLWEIDVDRRELRRDGVAVPLGGRAFDILEVLARSAGGLVAKEDLVQQVWPGMAVGDNTLHVHLSAIRKALGSDRGLIRTIARRGYQLAGAWRAEMAAAPPEPPDARGNLPVPSSELIGRDAAVRHVAGLVAAHRVVTLTGPGGIGKTRLGLEVARTLLAEFPDGAWLVELAPLSDTALLPSVLAGVLGLAVGSEVVSITRVVQAIGARRLLILLDSCEHVVEGAARLAEAVAQFTPAAHVLATSREALRIDGESTWLVPPLDTPVADPAQPTDPRGPAAIRLFLTRAAAMSSRPDPPAAATLDTIGAICRRLDGIPLAIELAAARAATFGVEAMARDLDDRFAVLTGGRRTAPARQQTLRATLDWSHDLLPGTERRILRQLGVFNGGFLLAAGCAVLASEELPGDAVAAGIGNLVNKSLVAVDMARDPPRYLLLDTIRAYALEKLAESGEFDACARRHAAFFRDVFERAQADWGAQPIAEWLSTYRREVDNLRAALDWAFCATGDASIGIMLAANSILLMFDLSLIAECHARAERALQAIAAGVAVEPRRELQLLAALQAIRVYVDGPSPANLAAWERVLAMATRLGDFDYQARALWGLWNDHVYAGRPGEAQGFAERFAALTAAQGDATKLLLSRRLLSVALHFRGEQAAARAGLEEFLGRFHHDAHRWRTVGSSRINHSTVAQATLARILWLQGEAGEARRLSELALRQADADDHLQSELYVLVEAAVPIAFFTGDLAAAHRLLDTLLDRTSRSGFRIWLAYAHCFRAMLRATEEPSEATLAGFAAAVQQLRGTGFCAHLTMFLAALATAQGRAGALDAARRTIEDALDRCARNDERWCLAEALRVQGEVLLLTAAETAAASRFRAALEWARRQGALAWELRAAISLARLPGRRAEAVALLRPLHDRFGADDETADLIAAREILRQG
jgi:predicted ATPase/DNA-binding winged helix-turn-helix (wHTH) protein